MDRVVQFFLLFMYIDFSSEIKLIGGVSDTEKALKIESNKKNIIL